MWVVFLMSAFSTFSAPQCQFSSAPVSRCAQPQPPADKKWQPVYEVWKHLDQSYAYFAERKVDWNCAYEVALAQSENPKEGLEKLLAQLGGQDPLVGQDGHVMLNGQDFNDYLPGMYTQMSKRQKRKAVKKLRREILKKTRALYLSKEDLGKRSCHSDYDALCVGVFSEEQTSKKVGYIGLDSMETDEGRPLSKKTIRKAISQLEDTDAIVIDVLWNTGGYDKTALRLLGHFVEKKTLSHFKQVRSESAFQKTKSIKIKPKKPFYGKKVYILIGPTTASAAEILAIGSLQLPNVQLVGTETEGVTSDLHTIETEWGDVDYSAERYFSPSCEIFEVKGVSPDIRVSEKVEGEVGKRNLHFTREILHDLEENRHRSFDAVLGDL